MPSLKSRTQCPPNGFIHTEAQTGWTHQWWDFELAVREIRDHRLGNPRFNLATDIETIRQELDQENALRCLSIRNAEIYVNGDAPPPKHIARPAAAVVAGVVSGLQTIGAWLGKGGKPVAQELANSRAGVCVKCPKNNRVGDWKSLFTKPAAALLQKEIEHRNKLKLQTPFDADLGVCDACGCVLRLKTHTPLVDIVEHMTENIKNDLHPDCWILKE